MLPGVPAGASTPNHGFISKPANPDSLTEGIVDNSPERVRLLTANARYASDYPGDDVPRPPYWGGYVVRPQAIEFWQAGEFRLHDRFVYARAGDGWRIERLSP